MANRSLSETLTTTYDLLHVLSVFQEFNEFKNVKKDDIESLKVDLAIHICEYLYEGDWQFDSPAQKQLSIVP